MTAMIAFDTYVLWRPVYTGEGTATLLLLMPDTVRPELFGRLAIFDSSTDGSGKLLTFFHNVNYIDSGECYGTCADLQAYDFYGGDREWTVWPCHHAGLNGIDDRDSDSEASDQRDGGASEKNGSPCGFGLTDCCVYREYTD